MPKPRRRGGTSLGDFILLLSAFAVVFVGGFLFGDIAMNRFSINQFQREAVAIDRALELYSKSHQMSDGSESPAYPEALKDIGIQQTTYGVFTNILHRRDNFDPANARFIYTPHPDESGKRYTSYTLQIRMYGGQIYTSPGSAPLKNP